MTVSKRDFLRLGGSAAVALVAAASPVTIDLGGSLRILTVKYAQAKDGNNGNGNGGGNSGGGGNRGGGGNSGGSGNGGGSSGNSGSGNSGGGNSKSNAGSSSSAAASSAGSAARATAGSDGSINVRHANGITESLRSGRYIMKDSKGRTIISRQATARDASRLSLFLR
ncbi:hypothetical protein HJB56_00055 [Rhizobium lentis]|uniref:hypothetical protein n=1 Tax=Rhizobium lentis TaxID=1138194 RepID=UPI001C82FB9F|nr:hypothetical protein [Rhizobium lentis]MBX4953899.1 hypothetical protein [Rhizobium lentis]MBX4983912.1 hypothetical protein [Rhizobium lentis]MBX5003066.1 hypothetical protein [Rhizobium lentis]MBX5027985.1 hypothetical protein [Rhizobium lentis]MBX5032981.1 hypothetical protein [Rhizobium lentis]